MRGALVGAGWLAFLALIVAAPIVPWTWTVGASLAAAAVAAIRLLVIREKLRFPLLPFALLGLFVAWGALQAIPLPQKIVEAVSPRRMALERESLQGIAKPDAGPRAISIEPDRTARHTWRWLSGALAMVTAAILVRRRTHLRLLLAVMAAVAGGEALAGMVNGTGSFVNRNHFAGLLAMGFFAALGVLIDTRLDVPAFPAWRARLAAAMDRPGFWKAALAAGLVVLIGLGLVISLSRGAVIATSVALVLFLALSKRSAVVAGAMILLSIAAVWIGIGPLQSRLENIAMDGSDPASYQALFRMAWQVFETYPVGGAGLGTYPASTAPLWSPHMGSHMALFAHNDYLDVLAGTGAIGGTLLFGALIAVLVLGFRRANNSLAVAVLCAVAAIVATSNANFNLSHPGNSIWFFALAGALAGRAKGARSWPLAIGLLAIAAVGTVGMLNRPEEVEELRVRSEEGDPVQPAWIAAAKRAQDWTALGRFQRLTGEPCDATLVTAVTRHPASAAPLVELGWSGVKDPERADRLFKLARQRDAADPWILRNCFNYWITRPDRDELAATAASLLWSGTSKPDVIFEELALATGSLDFLDRLLPEATHPSRGRWERELAKFRDERRR